MNKKGFTLIELLAVIVILAIIVLIATPVILNVIETAKKGATESSALGYLTAVENQVAINAVDTSKEDIVDGEYEVSQLSTKGVSVKGNEPKSGTLIIANGQVTTCSLIIDKYTVTCLENGNVQVGKIGITTEEPDLTKTKGLLKIVYLDPTDYTKKCDTSNSVSTTGTKEGCMKWYAYKDDGTNYTMILDHNTTPLVAWNSEGNKDEGMKDVAVALESDTSTWNSSLNARLITADEIAEITGAKEALKWDSNLPIVGMNDELIIGSNVSVFFFDGNDGNDSTWRTQVASKDIKSKYDWLYNNLNNCLNYGCSLSDDINKIYGYWTSTLMNSNNSQAYAVCDLGRFAFSDIKNGTVRGLRPVITLSKSLITEN